MNEAEMKQEFDLMLPWFVNGTLGGREREWMLAYLAEHPDAAVELRKVELLREDMHAADATAPALDRAWDRLRFRIQQEPRRTAAAAPASLATRLREWLGRLATPPAFAAAAALVVVQAGVIGVMVERSHTNEAENPAAYRSIAPGATSIGPFIQVTFKQDATERSMRLLLVEINGSLVGGPGQLGSYFVSVPQGHAEAAAATLRESRIVETVAVIKELPSRE